MSNNMDKFVPTTPPALFVPHKKETQPKLSLSEMLAAKQAAKSPLKQAVADSEMSGTANTTVTSAFGAASNAMALDVEERTRKLEKDLKRLTHEQNESLKELKREKAINARTVAELTAALKTAEESNAMAIAELTAAIKTAEEEKNEIEKTYNIVFGALTKANDTADEANYHADQCDEQVKELKTTVSRLENEKKIQNTMNRRFNQMTKGLKLEVESLEEDVDNKNEEIQAARGELETKTKELQAAQNELEAVRMEAFQISDAGDRSRILEEHQQLVNEFQKLEDEKAKLMFEGQTIMDERNQLKLQLSDANIQVNTLQQDLVRVRTEITQAQPHLWELQQAADRATALDLDNKSLTEKLEQSNRDLAQIKLDHAQAIEAKDQIISDSNHALLDSNFKDTSNVQNELRKSIEELQAKNSFQAATHQHEIAAYEAKIAELSEGQEKELLSLRDSYQRIVTNKEETIAQAQAQAESASKDLASVKLDLSNGRECADALQLKVNTLQGHLGASRKIVLALQSEAKHVRTGFDVLQDEMTSTRTFIGNISRKIESAKKQLAEKEEELAAEKGAHEATKGMHAAAINQLAKDRHSSNSFVTASSRQQKPVPRRTALRPIGPPIIDEEEPEFLNEDPISPVRPVVRRCMSIVPEPTAPFLDFDEGFFMSNLQDHMDYAKAKTRRLNKLSVSKIQTIEIKPAEVFVSDSIPKVDEPIVKVDLPQATEKEKQDAEAPTSSSMVVVAAVSRKKHVRTPTAMTRFSLLVFLLFLISFIAMSTKVAPAHQGPVLSIGMARVAAVTPPPLISTAVSTDPMVATVTTISVEEPKSTELVGPVSWDKFPLQVLYPTRILHLGERVLESTFHYWKVFEVRILRVVNLFRRGG
ncbi:hypothetical protein EAF04_003568 [Stromatinia cepivora]|nr:hypothetical protein EAF04_003568 [Stromatinia cepivora]